MKYLETLLARETGRPFGAESQPGACPTPTAETDKRAKESKKTPFVGTVSVPPATIATDPLAESIPDRPANPNETEAFEWPDRWIEAFQERAAIMEHDGGLARAEAERRATLDLANRTRVRDA